MYPYSTVIARSIGLEQSPSASIRTDLYPSDLSFTERPNPPELIFGTAFAVFPI
jgi:hypothetical protein